MNAGETQGYILTFRCVNCGKQEVFANYPSKDLLTEDEVRARIYQVSCGSCGWRGDACGLSAIHISHTTELKVRMAGKTN
jgi:transcription elongation factor Elf1